MDEERKPIAQTEVNELYKQSFINLTDAGRLMGMSRQGLWYLTQNGTFKMKRNDVGRPFVRVSEIREYIIKRRKELLDQLEKLKLPTD